MMNSAEKEELEQAICDEIVFEVEVCSLESGPHVDGCPDAAAAIVRLLETRGLIERSYEPIKGYAGFADETGRVVVLMGERAMEMAQRLDPFPVYRAVTNMDDESGVIG